VISQSSQLPSDADDEQHRKVAAQHPGKQEVLIGNQRKDCLFQKRANKLSIKSKTDDEE
jgi:hypothetical protein